MNPIAESDEDEAAWTPDFKVLIGGFDEVFLAEAQRAADRATEARDRKDSPGVAGATAAAVLLAASACEARLSEYVTVHESAIGEAEVKEIRRPSRNRGDAAKQWQVLLANRVSTFRCDDSPEFRGLQCLLELRDLVAHRGARYERLGDWPKELRACVERKAIPVTRSAEIDWTSGAYVQQVGVWAAETSGRWLAVATGLGITVPRST